MFTRRKGILLMVVAPILFIISMLFLANTLVWPAESVLYKVGQVLCFVVAPVLLVLGIFMYTTARRAEKKEVSHVQLRVALPPKETFMRVCPRCRRDLSALPADIAVCPYCGEILPQRVCSACGKNLSQFPADIKNCPYCGKAISIQATPVEVKRVKVELPESVLRIRRYAKMTAFFGILVAVSFFILIFLGGFMTGPEPNAPYMFPVLHERQSALWNGVCAGVLLAFASAIARIIAGILTRGQIVRGRPLILRWILGIAMILLSFTSTFFGTHYYFDWYALGILIAVCLLIPKKYSMKARIILLVLASIFAFWPRDIGLFGPSLSDTWLISIALSSEGAEWGLGQLINFWALLCEKVLSVFAGVLLAAKKI